MCYTMDMVIQEILKNLEKIKNKKIQPGYVNTYTIIEEKKLMQNNCKIQIELCVICFSGQ